MDVSGDVSGGPLIKTLSRRLSVLLAPLNRRCPWWLPSLVAASVVVGLQELDGTAFLEQRSYNLLHQMRAQLQPIAWDDRIVVIAIDEASLAEYGRFPWGRERYAQLLDTLWVSQPGAVAFDLLLPEAAPADEQLAQAIIDSGNIVLAVGSDTQGTTLDVTPTLADPATGTFTTGFVNHWTDTDGVSRSARLYQNQFPALSAATVQTYLDSLANTQQNSQRVEQRPTVTEQIHPALTTPQSNRHWLNWPQAIPAPNTSDPASLTVLSFADVAEGRIDLALLQNKIVLVGVTALGIDPLRTPFHLEPPVSGVYLHAAVIDNLLNDRFLTRPLNDGLLLLLVLGLSVVTGYSLHSRSAKWQIIYCAGVPLAWLGIVYGAFTLSGWLPLAAPIGAVWLTAVGLQLQQQQDKQQLMNLFAMSVAPQTAQVIWQRKQEI
ncbi:MAG: CHASE2 domain-containing protein, partial [Cyanobacteria bacterium J06632_22]